MLTFIHHSASVHIPLALAVLFPPLYLSLIVFFHKKLWPRSTWWLLITLAFLQVGANILAYRTGMRDRMLSSAEIAILDRHQDLAFRFQTIWIVIAGLVLVAFWSMKKSKAVWYVHGLVLALLLMQLFWGVQLGQLGGQLVSGF